MKLMSTIFFLVLFCIFPLSCGQVNTIRNRELISFNGYEMRKREVINNGETQVWVCIRNDCNGRAHSPINSHDLREVTAHNHIPDNTRSIIRERIEHAKTEAKTHLNTKPKTLWQDARRDLTEEQKEHMVKFDSFRRTIEKTRIIPERLLVDEKDMTKMQITGPFAQLNNGQNFLLYDSIQTEPNLPRIIIFASNDGLQRLRRYKFWSGDGTFHIVPSNFYQLYTICVLIEHSAVPSAYVLMPKKDSDTYVRVFQVVKNHLQNDNPLSFLMDFELAAKQAALYVWNGIVTQTCIFHLAQSVTRKVQKLGLIRAYANDDDMKKNIRSLTALALLREELVEDGFNLIKSEIPPVAQPVAEYFYRTYIARENGHAPLFPKASWNHHHSVLHDMLKTNNAQEAFHLELRSHFTRGKPPLSRLIIVLKNEEELATDKTTSYERNPANGITLRKRPKTQKALDADLRKLVQDFDGSHPDVHNITNDDLKAHIYAIQWNLVKKKIDDWYRLLPEIDDDNEPDYQDNNANNQTINGEQNSHENNENSPELSGKK